jgi:hypothetical protein
MVMQQDVTFMTAGPQALHCVRAAFRMIYYGPLVHFSRPQEVPALFLHRQFTRLAYYDGPSPWTRGALRIVTPHNQYNGGPPAPLVSVTECWAAYLMPNVDWGVGIYFPHARQFTAYRYDGYAADKSDGTSYISPVVQLGMRPGRRGVQFKYQYAAYVMLGNLVDIRNAVTALGGNAP